MGRVQHYVPQFYLKNFSENNKTIVQYILKSKIYVEFAPIKKIAASDFLYGEDDKLEHELVPHEGEWARIVAALLNGNAAGLNLIDYGSFLLFITNLWSRTLKAADYCNNLTDAVWKRLLHKKQDKGNFPEIDVEELQISQKIPNKPMMFLGSRFAYLLRDLEYLCIINESNTDIITTDSPVVLYNQFCTFRNTTQNQTFSALGLQLFIPLSPKMCICLFDKNVYKISGISQVGTITIQSDEEINKLNTLLALNAFQFIYSKKSSKDYLEKISERHQIYTEQIPEPDMQFSFVEILPRFVRYRIPQTQEKWIRPTCRDYAAKMVEEIERVMAKAFAENE
ncbi:MAG: DUF4238 domain-containing protein [Methanocorpusculum sp.]|nr:DUF4238 domain-containing protein [Methanocorpusculum sp.]